MAFLTVVTKQASTYQYDSDVYQRNAVTVVERRGARNAYGVITASNGGASRENPQFKFDALSGHAAAPKFCAGKAATRVIARPGEVVRIETASFASSARGCSHSLCARITSTCALSAPASAAAPAQTASAGRARPKRGKHEAASSHRPMASP